MPPCLGGVGNFIGDIHRAGSDPDRPLLAAAMWLWGERKQVHAQRHLVIKVALAIAVSLTLSWTIGQLFPHERPFVENVGHTFLHHAPDNSFPSDHGTVIFTFALAFLFWHRLWSGLVLMVVGWRLPGPASISAYTGRWICSAVSSAAS